MFVTRLDAWIRQHPFVVDTLTTGVLGVFLALPYFLGGTSGTFLWSVALLAPLCWRRTRPVASSFAVCTVALLQWMHTNSDLLIGILPYPISYSFSADLNPLLAADLAVPITVHAATCYAPPWARRAALASGLTGAFLLGVSLTREQIGVGDAIFATFMLASPVVGAWAIGSMRRVRLDHVHSLRERARLLEVERDQKARLAVTAERSRIAREMHDVVAHSLAVMIAQADGGRYSVRSAPDAAEEVLQTIGDTGRKALAEMRQLLAVLRTDLGESWEPETSPALAVEGDTSGKILPTRRMTQVLTRTGWGRALLGRTLALPAGPDPAGAGHVMPAPVPTPQLGGSSPTAAPGDTVQLRPQPRLMDLEELVHDVRSSGQQVELSVNGDPVNVVPGLELAAYRIVQESLTNVLKHAGPGASTRIHLDWSPQALRITVVDDGRGAGAAVVSDGHGMGLIGMQERASVYGGQVEAGPVIGGGFQVIATLPLLPDLTG